MLLLFMLLLVVLVVVVVLLVFVVVVGGVVVFVFVVVVVVVFALVAVLALFVLSAAQPAQREATASKAKRAKVLRIEFSPVTQWVKVLRASQKMYPAMAAVRSSFSSGQSTRRTALHSVATTVQQSASRGMLIIHN
jgi:membrane-bound ClpP family serine protease